MSKAPTYCPCGRVKKTLASHCPCQTDKERHDRNVATIARILAKWAGTAALVAVALAASCNGDSPVTYHIP